MILPLLQKHGVTMTPADSEHSAIFQALQGVPPGGMRKVSFDDVLLGTPPGRGLKSDFTRALLLNCTLNPNSN